MAEAQTLRIPIGLDTKEVQSDAKNMATLIRQAFDSSVMKEPNKEIQKMALSLKSAYQQVTELSEALEKVNNTPIKTDDYIEVEKQIERDTAALSKLSNKMWEFKEWGGDTKSDAFNKMEVQADELRNSIEYAKGELQDLVDTGKAFKIDTDKAEDLTKKLDIANDKLKIQYGNWQDIVRKQEEVNAETEDTSGNIEKSNKAAEKLSKNIKNSGKEASGLNFSFKKLAKTMLGVTLGAQGIVAVLRKMVSFAKEGITNLAKEDVMMQGMMNTLTAKTTQFKNSLGAIAAPLIQLVVPVIAKIIDMLTKAANMVAKLVGKIMGNNKVTIAKTLGMDEGQQLNDKSGSGSSKKTPEEKYQDAVAKAQAKYDKELAKYQEKVTKNEEKQAKAAAKLAKQQEKANKQLSGFDELNVLTSDSIDDTLESYEDLTDQMPQLEMPDPEDYGLGGDGTLTMFEDVPVDDAFPDWLQNIIDRLKELGGLLKKGFFDGLGGDYKTKIDDIKKNLGSIKDSLIDIWTDPEVVRSANGLIDSFVYLLGSFAGSVASIGLTIAQNLIGGIAKWLEQDSPRIKTFLTNIFDVGADINNTLSTIFQDIADMFSVFGNEDGQQITADIISIFTDPFFTILELAGKFIGDLLHTIWDPIHEHKEEIKGYIEDVLGWISQLTGIIRDFVQTVDDVCREIYDEHIKPAFDNIKTIIDDVLTGIKAVWDDTVKPVMDDVMAGLQELWEYAKPVIEELGDAIGAFIDAAMAIVMRMWEILKPIFAWIHEHIGPILTKLLKEGWELVKNTIKDIIDVIKPVVSFIKNVFKLITDLVNGDWTAAWEDCKNIFKNVWDFITGLLKLVGNFFNNTFGKLIESAKTWGKDLIDGFVGGIKEKIDDVSEWASNIADRIKEFIHFSKPDKGPLADFDKYMPDMMKGLAEGIKDNMHIIENMLNHLTGTMQKMIQGLDMSKIGQSLTEGLMNGLQSGLSNIVHAMNSLLSIMSNAVQGLIGQARNWGMDLIDGIIDGIYSMLRYVGDAARSVADCIWSYLHFSEPEIGPLKNFHTFMPDMIESMVTGINNGIPDVEKALDNLSYGIASGTQISPNMQRAIASSNASISKNDMYSVMRQALSDVVGTSGYGIGEGDIIVQIDGTEVFRAVRQQANIFNKQTGISAFA